MKKIISFAAAMLCMVSAASAQTFDSGSQVLGLGIGVGGGYGVPVTLSYEHGIHSFSNVSHIGVGGNISYGAHNDSFSYSTGTVKYNYNNVIIAAMANYHYTGVDKFDFYGGVHLGYDIVNSSVKSNTDDYAGKYKADASGMFFGVRAGARYYFSDNWAASADLGYGLSILNIGVAYKF